MLVCLWLFNRQCGILFKIICWFVCDFLIGSVAFYLRLYVGLFWRNTVTSNGILLGVTGLIFSTDQSAMGLLNLQASKLSADDGFVNFFSCINYIWLDGQRWVKGYMTWSCTGIFLDDSVSPKLKNKIQTSNFNYIRSVDELVVSYGYYWRI